MIRRRFTAAVIAGATLLVSGVGIRPSATAQASAYLQIVHAVPDLGAVDALVNGQPIAQRLAYGTTSDWKTMPGGGTRLQIRASDDGSRAPLDVPVDLTAGGAATVLLIGRAADEPSLRVLVLHEKTLRPGNGRVRLRFVNTSAGGDAAVLTTVDGTTLTDPVPFGETAEVEMDAGSRPLRAVPAGRPAASIAETRVEGRGGSTYTIVLLSQTGGQPPPALLVLPDSRALAPVAAAGAPAGPGSVVVSETFTDPAGGLLPPVAPVNSSLQYGYVEGEYFLRNLEVATQSLSIPGDHPNATIAVDIRLIGETTRRTVSVGCRFTSDGTGNHGYRLRVEPAAGLYRLVREDGDRDAFLRNLVASSAINRGNATNRLELTCAGSTITAAINGVEVATVQDSTYTSGPLTIGVGARSDGLTSEARFDNLVVTQR